MARSLISRLVCHRTMPSDASGMSWAASEATCDRHEYLDEKRQAFEALTSLIGAFSIRRPISRRYGTTAAEDVFARNRPVFVHASAILSAYGPALLPGAMHRSTRASGSRRLSEVIDRAELSPGLFSRMMRMRQTS
jgi:hypothetical protein